MRTAIIVSLLFLASMPAPAQESEECKRPPTQELLDYKASYIPQEFHHEAFRWEVTDVVVLAVLLSVASLLSVRHQPRHRITAITVIALLYFGLFRGGCICPVGATTNFCMGLAAPELIGRTVAVLFLLPLVTAFFFGRVFCTSACPIGAIQHLFSRKNGYQIPRRVLKYLRLLPFAFLAATVWGALRGGWFLACKLDMYKVIFYSGHAGIAQLADWIGGTLTESRIIWVGDIIAWLTLGLTLLLGFLVHRPFCRFVCPYGVLLGFFALIGLRRRSIDPASCFSCVQCTKTCPTQAISADFARRTVKVSNFHCVQCGRCDETCKADSLESPSPYPDTYFPNIAKNRDRNRPPFVQPD